MLERTPNHSAFVRGISAPCVAQRRKAAEIAVACSLLDRQIAAQAKAFETEGGFTERLYRLRRDKRSHH